MYFNIGMKEGIIKMRFCKSELAAKKISKLFRSQKKI